MPLNPAAVKHVEVIHEPVAFTTLIKVAASAASIWHSIVHSLRWDRRAKKP